MNQLSLSRPKRLDAFFTRIEGDLHAILFEDILYILARRNYSEVCMANGKKLLVHVPIKVMEEKLPRHLFCRIHRSCVVAIHRITKVNCHDVFIGPLKLPLALKYYSDLEGCFVIISAEKEAKYESEPEKEIKKI